MAAPSAHQLPVRETLDFGLTEAGFAEYFRDQYGDLARYDHARRRWLVWERHRWQPDADAAVRRMALQSVRTRRDDAVRWLDFLGPHDPTENAGITDTRKTARAVLKYCLQQERRSALDSILSLASSLTTIADSGEDWDCKPGLLGCPNGVVDLRTGEIRDGRPSDRITMTTGVEYDPEARCPVWTRLLYDWLLDSEEYDAAWGGPDQAEYDWRVTFLQRLSGYSITGLATQDLIIVLMGSGGNGKSTFLSHAQKAAGDYGVGIDARVLKAQKYEGHSTEVADLDRARFVTCEEIPDGSRLNTERLKKVSGGGTMRAHRMRENTVEFPVTWCLWLSTNGLPKTDDNSWGFWRRICAISFPNRFATDGTEQLEAALAEELPGILAWLVRGAVDFYRDGIGPWPDAVVEATAEYREQTDPLQAIFDAGVLVAEKDAFTPTEDLYAAYCAAMDAVGRARTDEDAFAKALAGRFERKRARGGPHRDKRGFRGVRVGAVPAPETLPPV